MATTFYGDTSDFIAYCEERGYPVDSSPSPADEFEPSLLRGSEYIDGKYRSRFSGRKAGGRNQDREWPRQDATDADGEEIDYTEIPKEILHATYEAAFREYQNPGSLLPDYVASERVSSERVGPIAVSYQNSTVMSAADSWPVIGTIDNILAPLIGAPTSASKLFGEKVRI